MEMVVYVDAAPGFEDSVEANLRSTKGVQNVVRLKQGNHDMAVLVVAADAGELERLLANQLRTTSGVRGVEKVASPPAPLLEKLQG